MIKRLIIIFFILESISFAQKKIIIFKTDFNDNYPVYAAYDLIIKNLFLYSSFHIIPKDKIYDYKKVKSKIKELTINNNADISVLYKINKYREGFIFNYILYNREKPNEWFEENIFCKQEEKLFETINEALKHIYSYSKNKEYNKIKENEYISLIGYYSRKINDINDSDIYKYFFNFYKDNIYFNMDYLEYLMKIGDNTAIDDIKIIADNTIKYLNKDNHYYMQVLGDFYYSKYKVNVSLDDIEKAIENYLNAAKSKNYNYIYYEKSAKSYLLKNDYDNASFYYNKAVEVYDKDADMIKDAVYILKRDMNKNGNIVIEYLKKIIDINKNDDEALEELSEIYYNLGDKYNSQIYYSKLLETINYNLYIINNKKQNPVLYDRYMKKKSEVIKKLDSLK
ncbi:hypothetical protein [uncultured Brachyspira sp.]|uniref:tetratricopeptide repeat protein n=1 Tax=uncultured Brachyspira sp. TaxID=221953 RepID=UPI0026388016|nr:hypothetical protein [uncultured Brachyspira sp.]